MLSNELELSNWERLLNVGLVRHDSHVLNAMYWKPRFI